MSSTGEHPDSTFVMMRAEDRSLLMRLSYYLDKYKPIVWALVIFAASAGYGFKTPAQANTELRVRIDSVAERQKLVLDSLSKRVQRVERLTVSVEALLRIRCVETNRRTLQLAGIDCDAWLNKNAPPTPPGGGAFP